MQSTSFVGVEGLEARRLMSLTLGAVTPVTVPASPSGVVVRDDGTSAVVSRASDGVLTLRVFGRDGALVSGPTEVSGAGSELVGVGSDKQALDVDREGRVSVVYRRGGQVLARAFAADLTPLTTGEIGFGTIAPLDLAVRSNGLLVANADLRSLTVRRVGFNGTDLGGATNVVSLPAPKDRVTNFFDSGSIDTDLSGGFVVGWSVQTTQQVSLTRRLRVAGVSQALESDEFAKVLGGQVAARGFAADGRALGAAVTLATRKSLNNAEVEVATDRTGNAAVAWALSERRVTAPVFSTANNTFSAPRDEVVSSNVNFARLTRAATRLSLAARASTVFSGQIPDNASSTAYAGAALLLRLSPADGVAGLKFDTRTFARAGEELTADFALPVVSRLQRFGPAGAALDASALTVNDAVPESLAVVDGGALLLGNIAPTTGGTTFSVQFVNANRPQLSISAPTTTFDLGSRRTTNIALSLSNTGDAPATGPVSVSTVLRREGVADVTLGTLTGRATTIAPSGSVALRYALKLPAGVTAGTYTLTFTLDPEGRLADSDRTNNTVSVSIVVA